MKKFLFYFLTIASICPVFALQDLIDTHKAVQEFKENAKFAYEAQETIVEYKYTNFFINFNFPMPTSPMFYLHEDYIKNCKTNIDKYQFLKHYPKIYNY